MKVGVFAAMFQSTSFAEALDYVVSVGVDAVEIASGGYVGDAHCKPSAFPEFASTHHATKMLILQNLQV